MCNNKIIKGNFKRNKVVNNNNIDTVNGNIDQSYIDNSIDNSVKNYITIINTATSLHQFLNIMPLKYTYHTLSQNQNY